jgi:hypothetical protein
MNTKFSRIERLEPHDLAGKERQTPEQFDRSAARYARH